MGCMAFSPSHKSLTQKYTCQDGSHPQIIKIQDSKIKNALVKQQMPDRLHVNQQEKVVVQLPNHETNSNEIPESPLNLSGRPHWNQNGVEEMQENALKYQHYYESPIDIIYSSDQHQLQPNNNPKKQTQKLLNMIVQQESCFQSNQKQLQKKLFDSNDGKIIDPDQIKADMIEKDQGTRTFYPQISHLTVKQQKANNQKINQTRSQTIKSQAMVKINESNFGQEQFCPEYQIQFPISIIEIEPTILQT